MSIFIRDNKNSLKYIHMAKTVKIKESELIDLIDNLVTEAVAFEKDKWITEQANSGNKTPLLEQKLEQLQKQVQTLMSKK